MDRNKLAVLVNQLGGYDEAERVLGVDSYLIAKAVQGERLTGIQQAEVETGFNQLYLEPELALDNNIDIDELEAEAQELQDVLNLTYNPEINNVLASAVAEDKIATDDLRAAQYLFGNLEPARAEKIASVFEQEPLDFENLTKEQKRELVKISKNKGTRFTQAQLPYLTPIYKQALEFEYYKRQDKEIANNVRTMFEALKADMAQGGSFWDIEDSEFWEWFRDYFYGDESN